MAPPLLFDVHVHHGAYRRLREAGLDVAHAGEVGLAEADDAELLRAAAEDGRVVVTRNYRDFARLAEALAERGEPFPGVLFLSPAIPPSDPAAHVRAIRQWFEEAGETNPVQNTVGWVGPS